ncbi:hypothetical protein [Rhodopila sp.]|uniref:hypothetical protein n=1 Tax=Rhodopila sp. TaxID=2480087 RepID=UPI002CE47E59|nr:hypothetical protein [Rhodopila sp.]HVZ07997.1 hypothetical protein [Rhodopila sp.]
MSARSCASASDDEVADDVVSEEAVPPLSDAVDGEDDVVVAAVLPPFSALYSFRNFCMSLTRRLSPLPDPSVDDASLNALSLSPSPSDEEDEGGGPGGGPGGVP